jgi:hypothetical protein
MRKRTKTRTTQLLTMDELHARPCEVDGRPALFHRWVEEDRFIVQPTKGSPIGTAGEIASSLRAGGRVPRSCDFFEVVRETVALVEYGDGTIDKVKPELIRFIREEGQRGT